MTHAAQKKKKHKKHKKEDTDPHDNQGKLNVPADMLLNSLVQSFNNTALPDYK